MFTQQENRLAVEHAHNPWHPHVVYDLHQMGPRGPRLFVPPYLDPIDSNVDPHPPVADRVDGDGHVQRAHRAAQGRGCRLLHLRRLHAQPRLPALPRRHPHPLRGRERPHRHPRRGERRGDDLRTGHRPQAADVEQPHAVAGRALDAQRYRRVRVRRGDGVLGQRGALPGRLAAELLRHRRQGRPGAGEALRLPGPAGPARPRHGPRDAGHPALRHGGSPRGAGGVLGRRRPLPCRHACRPDSAALRRVRQDHAGSPALPRLAGVPGRPPQAPLRRHGAQPAAPDGRRRGGGAGALPGEAATGRRVGAAARRGGRPGRRPGDGAPPRKPKPTPAFGR